MKSARPCERRRALLHVRTDNAVQDAPCPPLHFGCSPARERQQKYALGVGTREYQRRNTMRDRVGLAGSGARDNQQLPLSTIGTDPTLDGSTLLRIHGIQMRIREAAVPADEA